MLKNTPEPTQKRYWANPKYFSHSLPFESNNWMRMRGAIGYWRVQRTAFGLGWWGWEPGGIEQVRKYLEGWIQNVSVSQQGYQWIHLTKASKEPSIQTVWSDQSSLNPAGQPMNVEWWILFAFSKSAPLMTGGGGRICAVYWIYFVIYQFLHNIVHRPARILVQVEEASERVGVVIMTVIDCLSSQHCCSWPCHLSVTARPSQV